MTDPPVISYCAENVSSYQARADSVQALLDKTQIPTGILYDRVSRAAGLVGFNAVAPDTSDFGHFRQAIYDLHASAYNTRVLPCQRDVRDYAQLRLDRDTVSIGVLHYRFNYLDSTAVANNLLYYDTNTPARLRDVVGRPRSPYLTREVTVAAALVKAPRYGVVTFRLDRALFFTNTGRALSSVSVDFGNGSGPQPLLPGQTVTVGYATTGPKVLRYTLYFSDGTQQVTKSSLTINAIPAYAKNVRPPVQPCYTAPLLTADLRYARDPYLGLGEVSYYYSTQSGTTKPCDNNPHNVTKPIILIDGFDHDDERKAGNIYADKLVYDDGSPFEQNFGRDLRLQGYDLVVLNLPRVVKGYTRNGFFPVPYFYRGGSTYIETNAYVLAKLIQQVKAQLQAAGSAEKLVIVGPSMGGQIARYALTYMEQQYAAANDPAYQHNTRLYISLDSPHNGANTPIGAQMFLKYFADDIGKAEAQDGLEQIDSPASRELSLQHRSQLTGNTVPFQADPERGYYVANLASIGNWPAQLRRVAVTNGSLSGQLQLKTTSGGGATYDDDQAFYLRGKFAGVGIVSARVNLSVGNGNTNRVLEGHYPIGRGRNYHATGPTGSCGLDAGPGGWFGVFDEIAEKVRDRRGIKIATIYSLNKNAAFIPMRSALAYQTPSGDGDNCLPINGRNLVCEGTTPFDAYYGPVAANEEHIQLTAGNVAFMRREIMDPIATPAPLFATGPTTLCAGSTLSATFAIGATCAPTGGRQISTTYEWTVDGGAVFSNGLAQISGPTTSQSFTLPSSANGRLYNVRVRARYNLPGATPSPWVLRSLYFTGGDITGAGSISGPDYAYRDFYLAVTSTAFASGPYSWRLIPYVGSPQGRFRYTGSNPAVYQGNSPQFVASVAGVYNFGVIGVQSCNGSPTQEFRFSVNVLASGSRVGQPTAYPNPAHDELTVRLAGNPGASATATGQAQVTLYNGQGRAVRQQTAAIGATDLRLSTADLPAGLYYVIIRQDGQTERQQLEIQH